MNEILVDLLQSDIEGVDVRAFLCCGKRFSGKDTFADIFADRARYNDNVKIYRRCIASSIKETYANENDLDLDRLLNDVPYKDNHRNGLIKLANDEREKNPYVWIEKLFTNIIKDITNNINNDQLKEAIHLIVISDCRFPEQIEFCEEVFGSDKTFKLRLLCNNIERAKRGWIYSDKIDNNKTETALDDYEQWNFDVLNESTQGWLIDVVDDILSILKL